MPSPDLIIGAVTGAIVGVLVTRLWLWWPVRKKYRGLGVMSDGAPSPPFWIGNPYTHTGDDSRPVTVPLGMAVYDRVTDEMAEDEALRQFQERHQ